MRNAKNIIRHEIIGLECMVVGAENKSQTGLRGMIVNETMKTVDIETGTGIKKIPKAGSKFKIKLDNETIVLDGNFILGRPEDRIKKKITKW